MPAHMTEPFLSYSRSSRRSLMAAPRTKFFPPLSRRPQQKIRTPTAPSVPATILFANSGAAGQCQGDTARQGFAGLSETEFEKRFQKVLHDGLFKESAAPAIPVKLDVAKATAPAANPPAGTQGIEVLLHSRSYGL